MPLTYLSRVTSRRFPFCYINPSYATALALLSWLFATWMDAKQINSQFLVAPAIAQETEASLPLPTPTGNINFSFNDVILKASALSKFKYSSNGNQVARKWLNISYDDYRAIRFHPQAALWKSGSDFELQFFHTGFLYDNIVRISTISDGLVTEVPYDPKMFAFESSVFQEMPFDGNGFSGFRVHYPLHSAAHNDEFLLFQGASYFKLLGRKQGYGLSARGIAVNTGLAQGEEFPYFREFWVEKPSKNSRRIFIYALLDSASLTGAYSFEASPDTNSEVLVRAIIFPRKNISKVGIAPLTSMFFYGENSGHNVDDFRPEVHDSDGLLIHSGTGEWLWRPLVNRTQLNFSYFHDANLQGFGLLQRDRDFNNYQDLDAFYQKRASYWVEPIGDWGDGHVELVEIPTNSEINDNITAFWVTKNPFRANERYEFYYRLRSFLSSQILSPGGRAFATRTGRGIKPGEVREFARGARKFVIDFSGGELKYLGEDQPMEAVVTSSGGQLLDIVAHKNTHNQGWRVFFYLVPGEEKTIELRAFLKLRGDVLTETWSYLWTAN